MSETLYSGHTAAEVIDLMCALARQYEVHSSDEALAIARRGSALLLDQAEQIAALESELERSAMRLSACGVAAQQNTEQSRKNHRLDDDSPYQSASYQDVCSAVDREIEHRSRIESLEAALRFYADPDNWKPGESISSMGAHRASIAERDMGHVACRALNGDTE